MIKIFISIIIYTIGFIAEVNSAKVISDNRQIQNYSEEIEVATKTKSRISRLGNDIYPENESLNQSSILDYSSRYVTLKQ